MIQSIDKKQGRIEIDLTSPEGNAFTLLGYASKWSRQLGLDEKEISKEMRSGDYDNLIDTLEKHFGDYIILYR